MSHAASTSPTEPLLSPSPPFTSLQPPLQHSNNSSSHQRHYSTKYSSPTKRWICLIAVLFFTCLSSGPVTSWPTFEPILGQLGVLGSTPNQTSPQLDQVYALTRDSTSEEDKKKYFFILIFSTTRTTVY